METILLATRSLTRNPLRTSLTMLGMAIGVAAFIAMVSFGEGARTAVVGQFEKLGINMLSIDPGRGQPGGRPPKPLDENDYLALSAQTNVFEFVAPIQRARADMYISYESTQIITTLDATAPEFFTIKGWPFAWGGSFDAKDMQSGSKVCVLGATPARKLFPNPDTDPLGKVILVKGKLPCRIVGVLTPKGSATSGRDLDDFIFMPYPTAFSYLLDNQNYSFIVLRPQNNISRAEAITEISSTLRATHKLLPNDRNDFSVKSSDDAIAIASSVSQILSGLLAGIAGVSLLVGGIGIMNIQLVAVAERTREIGIRSAIGASPQQIMRQFLAEAVALALCGTLIGSLIGISLAVGVAKAMKWQQSISLTALLIAVGFGGGVGILFGYLPARRASQLDPIDALRSE